MSTTDLQHLADLLRRRNEVDAEIAALINRPALPGHLGEWIAARIFDLDLHKSATHRGSDGVFRAGPQRGRSVNVKLYGYQEGVLDVTCKDAPDLYLVMTGEGYRGNDSDALTAYGLLRPIDPVTPLARKSR